MSGTALAPLRARWQQMAPRERSMVGAAALLVGVALLYWLAIAPAAATLRNADATHRALDQQLQQVLGLQAQAKALQSLPRQNRDEALRLLESSVQQRLGTSARTAILGERVTVTLSGTSPDALAQWLTQARVNARAVPAEARLTRNPAGLWDGTLVLNLPPR
ncbi:MAG: type II secretion system protein GspM [Ramlibacter sp.]